jgi:DNA primase
MADQVLQDIKDRLDIIEIVGGYIPLKKSGTNYKAVCPFHSEKSPSLMVSPQKQIWHCFGCGEGGDVFGFVMRYENLEFREALRLLADKAGVALPQPSRHSQEADISPELIRINNFAAKLYHQFLYKQLGASALAYIHQRGLSDETIKQWLIGFAPNEFDFLQKALQQKQVSYDSMIKAGVSAKNERGQMYDRFRNRITFPVFNYYGDVVGFSARTVDDKLQQAKYINSPETVIYNKSKILFGLNFAKEAIRKNDEVVVVEGQLDCIQAHQAGFANTVASSGTALTDQQLTILGRLTKNIKFCFDADSAGLSATRRAGELALKQGFRLKIIVLKNVKDPDELIRKSPKLWQKAISEAVWFLDFYLNRALDLYPTGSVEQKHYLSEEVLPLLGSVADPLEQDHYIHELSTKFAISEKVIRDQLKGSSFNSGRAVVETRPAAVTPGLNLEKMVLGGMLVIPEFFQFMQEEQPEQELTHASLRQLAKGVLDKTLALDVVKQDTLAKEAMFMVESELDNLNNNELALMRELKKSFYLLKLQHIKRRQSELTQEIKKAESTEALSKIEELTKTFARLTQERVNVEAQLN